MDHALPKKYPLAEVKMLSRRRELNAKFDLNGFRGRAKQVFYGHGILDPFKKPLPKSEDVPGIFNLPEPILRSIRSGEFLIDQLKQISPVLYREIARALIFYDRDSARYVVKHMKRFITLRPIDIARLLILNIPPYPEIINEYIAVFGKNIFEELKNFDEKYTTSTNEELQPLEEPLKLPEEILTSIHAPEPFDYDLMSGVESQHHFQIAAALIRKNYIEAERILDHLVRFKDVSLEQIGELLLEKNYYFLILDRPELFSGQIWDAAFKRRMNP